MKQKLSKCYPPTLEFIPLLLFLLTIYMTLSNYSTLPDKIPFHFNSQGVPDDWANKNLVFLYPGLSAFVYLLMTILNVLLAITKNPMSLINLPKQWKASLDAPQIEKLRVILNRYLFVLKMVIQGLLIYLLYISIQIALDRASSLGVPFFLLILAILTIAILMLWSSYRISKMPSQDVT